MNVAAAAILKGGGASRETDPQTRKADDGDDSAKRVKKKNNNMKLEDGGSACTRPVKAKRNKLRLKVRTTSGMIYLKVETSDSIEHARERLAERASLPKDFLLWLGTDCLDEGRLLYEYGISATDGLVATGPWLGKQPRPRGQEEGSRSSQASQSRYEERRWSDQSASTGTRRRSESGCEGRSEHFTEDYDEGELGSQSGSSQEDEVLDDEHMKWKLIAQLQERVPKAAWRGYDNYLGEFSLAEVKQNAKWFLLHDEAG